MPKGNVDGRQESTCNATDGDGCTVPKEADEDEEDELDRLLLGNLAAIDDFVQRHTSSVACPSPGEVLTNANGAVGALNNGSHVPGASFPSPTSSKGGHVSCIG